MWNSHRKEIPKLTFRALALPMLNFYSFLGNVQIIANKICFCKEKSVGVTERPRLLSLCKAVGMAIFPISVHFVVKRAQTPCFDEILLCLQFAHGQNAEKLLIRVPFLRAGYHLILASNSSTGQILRATLNWMGPYSLPLSTNAHLYIYTFISVLYILFVSLFAYWFIYCQSKIYKIIRFHHLGYW